MSPKRTRSPPIDSVIYDRHAREPDLPLLVWAGAGFFAGLFVGSLFMQDPAPAGYAGMLMGSLVAIVGNYSLQD